ncbi:TPA: hypothetical protein ACH3X1_000694 [Trebouxia sp. C0004]
MLMRFLGEVLLPADNILPTSLYLAERLIQSRPPDSCAYHACPKDDYTWDHLPRRDWAAHKEDSCPECGSHRFITETIAGIPCLFPAKEFWYFGVAHVIRSFSADPDWAERRKQPKDTSPGSLYGGKMSQAINTATSGRLVHPDSSGYGVGFDFTQIFNFKTHSSGVMFMRNLDQPEHIKGKLENSKPVLLLPDPKEPKTFKAYFQRVCVDLRKYGPQGPGLEVTEAILDKDGTVQKLTFMHTAFLLSVSADSPARQKMAMWPPVAAYLACGWCLFEGFKREDDGTTHFGGDAEAAEQIFLELGLCKVGDAKLQLSDNMQHQRAKLVEDAKASAQKSGCMGYSEFPRILSYVSYSDVWELPIYHAGKQVCMG